MEEAKNTIKPEVLISCLDVLCRASATLFDSDPKLAADINQAIGALSLSLEEEETNENDVDRHSDFSEITADDNRNLPQQNGILDVVNFQPIKKSNTSHGLLDDRDEIVDVLSNEVVFKNNRSVKK